MVQEKAADSLPKIVAVHRENSKIDHFITRLVTQDSSSFSELLDVLRRKGFSVSCDELQARHIRHNVRKDSDGDIDFHCLDDGFVMRKCLNLSVPAASASGGPGKQIRKKRNDRRGSSEKRDSGKRDSGKRGSGKRDSGKRGSGKRDSRKRDSGKRGSGKRDSKKKL